MRRIITTAGVLAVLACLGGAAYAATTGANSYTATYSFSQKGAGTKKKPVAAGLKLTYTAKSNTAGDVAAPLKNIRVVLDGINTNAAHFPTCSATTIDTGPKFDAACPKGSLIATGSVVSTLTAPSKPSSTGAIPCDPLLVVYNEGHGKDVYFFKTGIGHECAGLPTGKTPPYIGTASNSGGNLDENIPLPPDVSTDAGGTGLYGSLENETLTYPNPTVTYKGKKIAMMVSTGCKAGKHATTTSFTAQTSPSGATQTETVTYAAKC